MMQVSEELSSVETAIPEGTYGVSEAFQKNLVVWKQGYKELGYSEEDAFQKNLVVWKRVK